MSGHGAGGSPLAGAELMGFVATRDAARAVAFYRDRLGLRLVADERFALVFDADGAMLRVQKVRELVAPSFTVLGWKVADIAATVDALAARAVRFERVPGLTQDQRGIWSADATTKVAWFKDPDGNILSLTEFSATSRAGR